MSQLSHYSILAAATELAGRDTFQLFQRDGDAFDLIDLDQSTVMEQRTVDPAFLNQVMARAAEIEVEQARARTPPISDRQFFHGLSIWGLIPQDEAMEAVKTGFIPTALKNVIDQAEAAGQFPAGMTRFDVDILIAGATTYEYSHPVSAMIGQAFGWTDQQRADFWAFAAGL